MSAALYKNLVFVKFLMVSALFYFFLFTKAEICYLPHETHLCDVWYEIVSPDISSFAAMW